MSQAHSALSKRNTSLVFPLTHKIFSINGIDIRLHVIWYVIFGVNLAIVLFNRLKIDIFDFNLLFYSVGRALLTTMILLCTIGIHETAHILLAKYYKVDIRTILLMPFGGFNHYFSKISRPNALIYTALIGPCVNLLIAMGCLIMFPKSLQGMFNLNPTQHIFSFIIFSNLILSMINFFPAHPLDGAFLLRGILMMYHFGVFKTNQLISIISKLLGIGFIFIGIIFYMHFFLLGILGVYIFFAFSKEQEKKLYQQVLAYTHLSTLIDKNIPSLQHDRPLAEAVQLFLKGQYRFIPILQESRPLGLLTQQQLEASLPQTTDESMIQDLDLVSDCIISEDYNLFDVYNLIQEEHLPVVLVANEEGGFIGVITEKQIQSYYQFKIRKPDLLL